MTKRKEVSEEGKEKPHRNKEKLSKKDLEELMNMHIQTYKRVNGKVKRK